MRPLPEGVTCIRLPEEAELLEVAKSAAARHLHLITDGNQVILSPHIPPGWYRFGISVKEAA